MAVTCVRRVDAGGRNIHAREAKLHPERTGDGITVLRADEIDRGAPWAVGLSCRNAAAADYQGDEKLDPTANRRQHRTAPPAVAHYAESRFPAKDADSELQWTGAPGRPHLRGRFVLQRCRSASPTDVVLPPPRP